MASLHLNLAEGTNVKYCVSQIYTAKKDGISDGISEKHPIDLLGVDAWLNFFAWLLLNNASI